MRVRRLGRGRCAGELDALNGRASQEHDAVGRRTESFLRRVLQDIKKKRAEKEM